jgi:hypothetical protein
MEENANVLNASAVTVISAIVEVCLKRLMYKFINVSVILNEFLGNKEAAEEKCACDPCECPKVSQQEIEDMDEPELKAELEELGY